MSVGRIIHDSYQDDSISQNTDHLQEFHGYQANQFEEQHEPVHIPDHYEEKVIDSYVSILPVFFGYRI